MEGHLTDKLSTLESERMPPISYLFLIVMTAMFYDVHQETDRHLKENRVPGADFDEVPYADDTICISTDTKALNKFLEAIEWEGFRYGLKLNKKNVNS